RRGDAKGVEALLAGGVDVNARTRYGATALWFAAYKGHANVVEVLLKHKANPNLADSVWGTTPLNIALADDQPDIVPALPKAGARGGDAAFITAASQGKLAMLQAVLDSHKPHPEVLGAALLLAPAKADKVTELLRKAGAKPLTVTPAERASAKL